MKLDSYLRLHEMSERRFAELLGVSFQAVNNYRRGLRIPAPPIMRRIYETTGGAVTPADFLGLKPLGESEMQEASHAS